MSCPGNEPPLTSGRPELPRPAAPGDRVWQAQGGRLQAPSPSGPRCLTLPLLACTTAPGATYVSTTVVSAWCACDAADVGCGGRLLLACPRVRERASRYDGMPSSRRTLARCPRHVMSTLCLADSGLPCHRLGLQAPPTFLMRGCLASMLRRPPQCYVVDHF